jgi:hypothetical protein
MVAVTGTLPMDHGLDAQAVSDFAERRPPGGELAAPWKATQHEWMTQLGERGFRVENDGCDVAARRTVACARAAHRVAGAQREGPVGGHPCVDAPQLIDDDTGPPRGDERAAGPSASLIA